jgi:Tol biopolymer transport system component
MPEETVANARLDSWKEIATYLGRNERTVVRWEKEKDLPIHRIPGGQRQGVFAFRHELDNWLAGSNHTKVAVQAMTNGNGSTTVPTVSAVLTHQEGPSVHPQERTSSRWQLSIYMVIGFLIALLIVSTAYGYVKARFSFSAPQLSDSQQLTANGQEKQGLLKNGNNLYFGQEQDGWYALAEMPVDGGPIRVLWRPQANVLPVDISSDGKKLLALTAVGVEREQELWVVSLDGGEPRRALKITAHSAAWSPDGRTIAYAEGNAIFLTSEEEKASREIGSFTAIPFGLVWSEDGQRLHFILEDVKTYKATLWGQVSGEGLKTITLRLLPPPIEAHRDIEPYGEWTRAARPDTFFALGTEPKVDRTSVWLVQYGSRWWEPLIQMAPMQLSLGNVSGITFSKESSRLFLLSEPQNRTAFVRFDSHRLGFQHILPGVSGDFLDYSRDGRWITYTSYRGSSLWIGRADGSAAKQITFSPEIVELPRWSPDGKQIAYMSKRPNSGWRIYLLQLDNGAMREASEGNDSQGAPTWSPDGRFLAYGNVECEHTQACAIHRIDLATGKVQTLPDSDGLFTARWSPDGRSIAAFHLARHQLFLFDVKAEKWHKLMDSIDGNDLSWSADSKYLYTNIRGTNARIVRIRTADGQQTTVLNLRSQDQFDLAENDDLQFSVAPDESVILHRRIHAEEIYAYDLRFH